MKTLRFLLTFFLLATLSLVFVTCGDDDDDDVAPLQFDISGTVAFPDFNGTMQNARGAVVYLAKNATSPTTNYDLSTVANASGSYTFENLEPGDYFMFSNFNTENTNVNGRIVGINFDSGEGLLFSIDNADVVQNMTLSSIDQAVNFVVDTREGGDWDYDASHSNIDFEFPYDEFNATYSGRFDAFDIAVYFDKDNLSSSSIDATIDLLSVNTSSRGGRDSFFDASVESWNSGCLASTFGVDFTPDDPPIQGFDGIPVESTRYASFTSTSIETYGDGFLAKGNFTFNGQTNQETLFFRFIEGFQGTNRSGLDVRFSSFDGILEFDALDDYGIESSHLGDKTVTVHISNQVNKVL